MGEIGPCGPCTEIHIDLGEGTCPIDHECGVNVDGCWRFVELWNLVFIQFNRLPDGRLETLPALHVDTGMGLERICRVLQGVDSNYDTDLFVPLLRKIEEITGVKDQEQEESSTAFRVIADHLRSLSFAIADGAIPSNEGRGYVLRRMLRRATRFGRILNMEQPFIYQLVPTLVSIMGEAFPELVPQQEHVMGVIRAEEQSFGQTLDRGLDIFEQMIATPHTQQTQQLSGSDAFKLYDTYGFPIDLTTLMCEERNLSVDQESFERLMEQQRKQSRESKKFQRSIEEWTIFNEDEHSKFIGYHSQEIETSVQKFCKKGEQTWWLVLNTTPFYAESGGQVSDQGELTQENQKWKVVDVQKEGDSIIHICQGEHPPTRLPIYAAINHSLRMQITRNHTATHLLQAALKKILGEHVHQAGSIVQAEYLRFDFTHFEKLSSLQIEAIEKLINEEIRHNETLQIYETDYHSAIDRGVTALFGEKYGDQVRVVNIEPFSSELCGGCHVKATGDIGFFKIVSEGAVASGVRRIVAITGDIAEQNARQHTQIIDELKQILNTSTEKIAPLLQQLIEEKRNLSKELQTLQKQSASDEIAQLLSNAKSISGIQVLVTEVTVDTIDTLKSMGDTVREQMKPGIAILSATFNGKPMLLSVISEDLVKKKLMAGELINQIAAIANGRGGGKPHMAQAGAKNPEKIPLALAEAPAIIQAYLAEKLA